VSVDEILGLRVQTEVCEDDISAFLEEEAGEFEVYAQYSSACTRPGVEKLAAIPEPAPVTIAVLPLID
jgi:hypothetical protein